MRLIEHMTRDSGRGFGVKSMIQNETSTSTASPDE
jgi:hypothetical protein